LRIILSFKPEWYKDYLKDDENTLIDWDNLINFPLVLNDIRQTQTERELSSHNAAQLRKYTKNPSMFLQYISQYAPNGQFDTVLSKIHTREGADANATSTTQMKFISEYLKSQYTMPSHTDNARAASYMWLSFILDNEDNTGVVNKTTFLNFSKKNIEENTLYLPEDTPDDYNISHRDDMYLDSMYNSNGEEHRDYTDALAYLNNISNTPKWYEPVQSDNNNSSGDNNSDNGSVSDSGDKPVADITYLDINTRLNENFRTMIKTSVNYQRDGAQLGDTIEEGNKKIHRAINEFLNDLNNPIIHRRDRSIYSRICVLLKEIEQRLRNINLNGVLLISMICYTGPPLKPYTDHSPGLDTQKMTDLKDLTTDVKQFTQVTGDKFDANLYIFYNSIYNILRFNVDKFSSENKKIIEKLNDVILLFWNNPGKFHQQFQQNANTRGTFVEYNNINSDSDIDFKLDDNTNMVFTHFNASSDTDSNDAYDIDDTVAADADSDDSATMTHVCAGDGSTSNTTDTGCKPTTKLANTAGINNTSVVIDIQLSDTYRDLKL
jgi:hypothetical protein